MKVLFCYLFFILFPFMTTSNAADIPRTLYVENSLARTLSMMTLDEGKIRQNVVVLGQVPNQVLSYREQLLVLNSSPAELLVIDVKNLTVTDHIPLPEGSNPYAMAYIGARRLYVTLLLANSVASVDLVEKKVNKLIAVGTAPQGILVDGTTALVANTGGWPNYSASSVTILDTRTDAVFAELSVPSNPQIVRWGPDFRYYVLCSGAWGDNAGKLAVIDPYAPPTYASPAVVDTLSIGGYPGDLAVLPNGSAYLSDWGDAANGFLYKVNIYTGQVETGVDNPIRVGRGAMRFLWDKATNTLYISNFDQDTIQKLSLLDGRVLATYPMGDGAQDMAIVESIDRTDPWADEVTEFRPGNPWSRNGYDYFPFNVLGPPDPNQAINERFAATSPQEILALGHGGSITVKFTDNVIINEPGPDFIIFENVFINAWTGLPFIEAGIVSVSQDGDHFYTFPYDTTTYKGLAGVKPIKNTAHPQDPDASGGDVFDLNDVGLEWVRYVRITDMGDIWQEGPYNGDFDLDAVVAVHSQEADTTTQPEIRQPVMVNFPNPFNQGTVLHFVLEQEEIVTLKIFSIRGQCVYAVNVGLLFKGPQAISWDGQDNAGRPVSSGIYFAELITGGRREIVKMTVLH